jgi:centromere protein C
LTVPDSGIRDENGLEPMDHLFSSPEKATRAKKINGHSMNVNGTISSEEDMDVGQSTFKLAVAEDKD